MRIAAVQFKPEFAAPGRNAAAIAAEIRRLGGEGVELAVFPEAALTGYCFSSAEQARGAAVAIDSAPMREIQSACLDAGVHVIVGFAEDAGASLHNTAAFYAPDGLVGVYRKTHLPCLGLDRFVKPGEELRVFVTKVGRIGILICFDIRIPEAVRELALQGAELICLPTNWPESAEPSSDIICPARAIENHVFVAASNRVGEENGFRFVGRSKIIAPGGKVLAALDNDEEGVLIADLNLPLARSKHIVKRPGEYEMDLFEARRPELYNSVASI